MSPARQARHPDWAPRLLDARALEDDRGFALAVSAGGARTFGGRARIWGQVVPDGL